MDFDTFAAHFRAASTRARDFAAQFIEEPLPEELRYRVQLNSSYDRNPLHADEVTFPDDGSIEKAKQLAGATADRVLSELWRAGKVPEWVDLSIVGETGAATVIGVSSCGRFTDNEGLLYHYREGYPPIHVSGPALPVGYDGAKFSIYRSSSCWTLGELRRVQERGTKVWSLELLGSEFDDGTIAALGGLSKLEILELSGSSCGGRGFSGFALLPKLRIVRVRLIGNTDSLDLRHLPSPPLVEAFEVHGYPPRVQGAEHSGNFSKLRSLELASSRTFEIDAALPRFARLERLALRAPDIPSAWTVLPAMPTLQTLDVHVATAGDAEVVALAANQPNLDALHLRGSAVSDEFLHELKRWKGLQYLDVVDTRVTRAALGHLAKSRPDLRVLPRMKPVPFPSS